MTPKVLVVDDEPKWLQLVSQYLTRRNYQVVTALNGEEAVRKAAEDHPDLVIADIGMSGMDGYELCGRFRSAPRTKTIPFIFLTGRDHDADKAKARRIGADDYLTKPCPLERIAQSVETAMDRIAQAKKMPLEEMNLSGQLEDVDLHDLIQTLELNQRTGALVLSHGDRTGTLYFREGVIVDADIRSPKREQSLFVLLGWKTGRFVFVPQAMPDRRPITASMANILFEDLRRLETHERETPVADPDHKRMSQTARSPAVTELIAWLEVVGQRLRAVKPGAPLPTIVRILVAGVGGAGTSEVIHQLVEEFSQACWAVVGTEGAGLRHQTEFGRVRISRETVLHLVALRTEKRFWQVWETSLPHAAAVLLLVPAASALPHVRAFLNGRDLVAPALPVHLLFLYDPPADEPALFARPGISWGMRREETGLSALSTLLSRPS